VAKRWEELRENSLSFRFPTYTESGLAVSFRARCVAPAQHCVDALSVSSACSIYERRQRCDAVRGFGRGVFEWRAASRAPPIFRRGPGLRARIVTLVKIARRVGVRAALSR